MTKYVYMFSEGNGSMRELLGGKGANLAEMSNLGLPVPQGFTITTEVCTKYYNEGRALSDDVKEQIFEALAKIEEMTGKKTRRQQKSAAGFGAFGRESVDAGHDGHHSQPGS